MNAKAHEMGQGDGRTMAREAAEQGTKIKAGAKNFDKSLIDALGFGGTAKLFGFDASRDDLQGSPEWIDAWIDALSSYEAGASEAWDEFAESEDCKIVLSDFADSRNADYEEIKSEIARNAEESLKDEISGF